MSTLDVRILLPGRHVPATLSTDDPASSHGRPVLLTEGGVSYRRGELVAFGVGDVGPHGITGQLILEAAEADADTALLDRWNKAAGAYRERVRLPLTMAETFVEAGEGPVRSIDLDALPFGRRTVRHVVEPTYLLTRIPEGRRVRGLEYGAFATFPSWTGYNVRLAAGGPWAVARETPADDELHETDEEIVEAIRLELARAAVDCESWTFPDTSAVIRVGSRFDVAGPDGRTGTGRVLR